MAAAIEGIRETTLVPWLETHVGLRAPLDFTLIAGGRSNLTFRVTDADGRAVILRRPPLGQVLATAHDMGREHRIISALGPTTVPVPATLAFCDELIDERDLHHLLGRGFAFDADERDLLAMQTRELGGRLLGVRAASERERAQSQDKSERLAAVN